MGKSKFTQNYLYIYPITSHFKAVRIQLYIPYIIMIDHITITVAVHI